MEFLKTTVLWMVRHTSMMKTAGFTESLSIKTESILAMKNQNKFLEFFKD